MIALDHQRNLIRNYNYKYGQINTSRVTGYDLSNLDNIYEVDNFIKWGFQTESQSELNCPFYIYLRHRDRSKP